MANCICIQPYESPCGRLVLGAFNGRLCLCDWAAEASLHPRPAVENRLRRLLQAEFSEQDSEVIALARQQLDAYFHRERQQFEIPLTLTGTDFQQRVWTELQKIPYGMTASYGELARRLGCPDAVRAVASANGANAISIIIPCHRIVGATGSLTGYAGGLPAKRYLLTLEQPTLL